MEATADNIWQVPAYLPYLQPALTDAAVAAAEEQIGYKLPPEYLDLLRVQNGGYIRYSLPEMVHDTIAGIGPHFPSLTDFDWEEVQEYVGYPLSGLVPFDGDGHWHLCLDYRHDEACPRITYADIECDGQSEIAASFAEYLTQLRIDGHNQWVLESITDIAAVEALLAARLFVDFDVPDKDAHGYPVHRAGLGSGGKPEWLWMSPNRAPRGFVRENHNRFDELRDLLPGDALRYPELGEDSYVVQITAGARKRVLDACTSAALTLRPFDDYFG
ncbi:MAG: SMI1/KNR4 family protein [Planctomycetota bacterium]